MKLYIGYIFSQGLDEVLAVGLSEWCINEGQADIYDDIEVDDDLALSLGLSSELSEHWARKEKEEDLEWLKSYAKTAKNSWIEKDCEEDEKKDQTNYWTELKLYAKYKHDPSNSEVYKVVSICWEERKVTLSGPWLFNYVEPFDDVVISDNPNM